MRRDEQYNLDRILDNEKRHLVNFSDITELVGVNKRLFIN